MDHERWVGRSVRPVRQGRRHRLLRVPPRAGQPGAHHRRPRDPARPARVLGLRDAARRCRHPGGEPARRGRQGPQGGDVHAQPGADEDVGELRRCRQENSRDNDAIRHRAAAIRTPDCRLRADSAQAGRHGGSRLRRGVGRLPHSRAGVHRHRGARAQRRGLTRPQAADPRRVLCGMRNREGHRLGDLQRPRRRGVADLWRQRLQRRVSGGPLVPGLAHHPHLRRHERDLPARHREDHPHTRPTAGSSPCERRCRG